MGCNCKKKKEPVQQEIKIPQSVDEQLSMELQKHAEELGEQIKNGNNNISDQTSERSVEVSN